MVPCTKRTNKLATASKLFHTAIVLLLRCQQLIAVETYSSFPRLGRIGLFQGDVVQICSLLLDGIMIIIIDSMQLIGWGKIIDIYRVRNNYLFQKTTQKMELIARDVRHNNGIHLAFKVRAPHLSSGPS